MPRSSGTPRPACAWPFHWRRSWSCNLLGSQLDAKFHQKNTAETLDKAKIVGLYSICMCYGRLQQMNLMGRPPGVARYRPEFSSQSQAILKLGPNGAIRYSPNFDNQSQSILKAASRRADRTVAAPADSQSESIFRLGPTVFNPSSSPQHRDGPAAARRSDFKNHSLKISTLEPLVKSRLGLGLLIETGINITIVVGRGIYARARSVSSLILQEPLFSTFLYSSLLFSTFLYSIALSYTLLSTVAENAVRCCERAGRSRRVCPTTATSS